MTVSSLLRDWGKILISYYLRTTLGLHLAIHDQKKKIIIFFLALGNILVFLI